MLQAKGTWKEKVSHRAAEMSWGRHRREGLEVEVGSRKGALVGLETAARGRGQRAPAKTVPRQMEEVRDPDKAGGRRVRGGPMPAYGSPGPSSLHPLPQRLPSRQLPQPLLPGAPAGAAPPTAPAAGEKPVGAPPLSTRCWRRGTGEAEAHRVGAEGAEGSAAEAEEAVRLQWEGPGPQPGDLRVTIGEAARWRGKRYGKRARRGSRERTERVGKGRSDKRGRKSKGAWRHV